MDDKINEVFNLLVRSEVVNETEVLSDSEKNILKEMIATSEKYFSALKSTASAMNESRKTDIFDRYLVAALMRLVTN